MVRKNIKKLSSILITSIMLVSTTLSTPVKAIANYENNKPIISSKRNVMYYGDWSICDSQDNFYPKDIPADQLTNLNFAFLNFDSNGNLLFTDKDAAINLPVGQDEVQLEAINAGILIALQHLRAENPNLKLGVSVGGWSKSANFPLVTKDSSKRANLVTNLIKFIDYTNMDLIDIDWEYPTIKREPDKVDNKNDEGNPNAKSEDKNNFILLLKDLREALDAKGKELGKKYELSVALPASINNLTSGIDIKNIFNLVDFANIMTYDMHGSFDQISGHHTGLYTNPKDTSNLSIDSSVKYLISNGAPSEKIVIGAAYYTRGWEKVSNGPDPKNPGLFGEASQVTKDADSAPSRGAQNEAPLTNGDQGRMSGLWSYRNLNKLKDKYPGLKEYWDDSAKAPYLYNPETGSFFTYDNVRSLAEKTSYVKEKNLGGIIGWMAAQDKPTNSSKRDELTKATKEGLYGQAPLPQNNIVYHKLNISTTVQNYKDSSGNDIEYEITFTNNEKLTEIENEVLKAVELGSKTIKFPKLYIKTDSPLTSGDSKSGTVTYKDGFTIVDLQSVSEGKIIDPGKSYSFKLKDTSEIKSIDLVQRMYTSSPDMYRQTIYENGSGSDTPKENTPPELKGVSDLSLKIGNSFSKLDGVTATDKEDGDVTSKIKVEGTVDTTKASSYKLTYTVINSKGLKTEKVRTITVVDNQTDSPDFGVGKGIKWPEQVFSPFVDMCSWITKPYYNNNGVIDLKKIYEDTGIKFFNLGFIGVIQENPVYNKKVNWKWGSIGNLNEELLSDEVLKNKTPKQQKSLIDQRPQYLGIKKSIKDIRDLGGDVTISIGGAGITPFWLVTQDKDTLVKTYKEIIQGYGLTRLDLDIESDTDKDHHKVNAQAIKKVQDDTGVDIVLTLSVSPSGLPQYELDVLEAYLSQKVSIKLVNIMTMCYGINTLDKDENYGTASLRAVNSTKDQLKTYFKNYSNTNLSDHEAYRKIGTTPSIGFQGESHPIFTTEWTELIVNQAIEKSLGMISFWSMNRDAKVEDNKGVRTSYEFTELCKKFPMHNNTNPVIKGASDKTINVGDTFDKRKGITAYDSENGDLTSTIKVFVNGNEKENVDTSKVGKSIVSYTVVDSGGLQTTVTITITVKNNSSSSKDNYDSNKAYVAGDIVIFNGVEYKAKWYVQGEDPDSSQAWTKNNKDDKDDIRSYKPGMVFVAGQKALYNGKTYEAKWWTNTVPGSDDSWKLIS